MKVKSESEVAQSCPPLRDPMDYSLPSSSVRGIFQARGLEWGAIAFSEKYNTDYRAPAWSSHDGALFLLLIPRLGGGQRTESNS